MSGSHLTPNPYRQNINQEIGFIEALAGTDQLTLDWNEQNQVLLRIMNLIEQIKLIEDGAEALSFLNRLHDFVTTGRLSMTHGAAADVALLRAMMETPVDLPFVFRARLHRWLAYALRCNRSLELYPYEAEDRLTTADELDPPKATLVAPTKSTINWKAVAVDCLLTLISRRRGPRS